MTDQTADTFLQALHRVCAEPSHRGFVVCSIVTDNTRNEIALVRDFRT
jgi:acetolactate synthase regulatory subunit